MLACAAGCPEGACAAALFVRTAAGLCMTLALGLHPAQQCPICTRAALRVDGYRLGSCRVQGAPCTAACTRRSRVACARTERCTAPGGYPLAAGRLRRPWTARPAAARPAGPPPATCRGTRGRPACPGTPAGRGSAPVPHAQLSSLQKNRSWRACRSTCSCCQGQQQGCARDQEGCAKSCSMLDLCYVLLLWLDPCHAHGMLHAPNSHAVTAWRSMGVTRHSSCSRPGRCRQRCRRFQRDGQHGQGRRTSKAVNRKVATAWRSSSSVWCTTATGEGPPAACTPREDA